MSTLSYTGAAGEAYFAQRKGAISDRNQELRASLFAPLGSPDATVLDFGCGTGDVLRRVPARRRIGIEIGHTAADRARSHGIDVRSDLASLDSASVDLAISFHAIEHVDHPAAILRELARVIRPGGRLRLVVPAELAIEPGERHWRPNRDNHLHTWTPLLFGNLAFHCGLTDIHAHLAPMPTRSRAVRLAGAVPPLGRQVHWHLARKRNALNTILDARTPA